MRPNPLRELFRNGGYAVNAWLHLSSTLSAEALSQVGFDSITIDLQHGPLSISDTLVLLQAMTAGDSVPLVRVPWNEPGIIMRTLDAGSYGVICPMISSRAEAEAFAAACRYPPLGWRSHGPTRASLYAGDGYSENANETILAFAMIETLGGLEHLEAILDVPGLDGVYVGPGDLSLALGGRPGADFDDGPVPEALERIAKAARERGKVAGIHNGSAAYARRMIDLGYQFVTVQSDLGFVTRAARETLAAVRGESAGSGPSGPY
jgi:4-hydroxy-2-oxoheptanedioate aldolase